MFVSTEYAAESVGDGWFDRKVVISFVLSACSVWLWESITAIQLVWDILRHFDDDVFSLLML